ncbi:uncharacterized protein LOC124124774 [Haliotis rufescens]|uniref:uncharacterized protein LOC124124774 n=1 Tax=Haliotis rufescens TaxID=6454 RepID=UPI00201F3236|nr:uncharacterized protein LOC124124774 [Haliotis rufescens]
MEPPTEIDNILEAFKRGKEKPKANSPEDFQSWLQDVLSVKTEVKPVVEQKSNSSDTGNGAQASAMNHHRFPRIPQFSGDRTGKETPYDVWRYRVDGLLESSSYTQDIKEQAIKDSLKGEAATIAVNMRPGTSISSLLRKLSIVFGVVEGRELRMAQFYSARQKEEEDVSQWACRLEELLSHALKDKPTSNEDSDEMLRSMLWTGLKSDLKNISGHKFDTINNFDDLLEALREIENNQLSTVPSAKTKTPGTAKSATAQEPGWKKEIKEMKAMINKLTSEVAGMRLTSATEQEFPYPAPDQRSMPSSGPPN